MKKFLQAAALLTLWQAVSFFADSIVFPSPFQVAAEIIHCIDLVAVHGGYSLYRIFSGILAALIFGAPVGILMGYSRRADEALAPLVYLAGPIPKVALLPLFMLFMGIGESPKLFIIFIVMVFQVILSVRDAVKSIPQEYFIPYFAARAGTRRIIFDILLPASVPGIFTAVRIGVATAISVLFFAETFGTRYGMGFFIMDSWTRLEYARMYGGVAVLGIMGLTLAWLIDFSEKRICKWK